MMMVQQSASAAAERLSRKRARMLPVLAVLFLAQQATYFTGTGHGDRTVDHVHIAAWLVMSVVLLLALATGGGWIYSKEVRALANDESTRVHRGDAFGLAFLASMAAGVALFVVSLYEPLDGRDAIHAIMTLGIATALVRFGYLERRALRDA